MIDDDDNRTRQGAERPPRAAGALRWQPPVSLDPWNQEPPAVPGSSPPSRAAAPALGGPTRTEHHDPGVSLAEVVASAVVALSTVVAICAALHLAGAF